MKKFTKILLSLCLIFGLFSFANAELSNDKKIILDQRINNVISNYDLQKLGALNSALKKFDTSKYSWETLETIKYVISKFENEYNKKVNKKIENNKEIKWDKWNADLIYDYFKNWKTVDEIKKWNFKPVYESANEEMIVEAINKLRADYWLKPLKFDKILKQASEWHSIYLENQPQKNWMCGESPCAHFQLIKDSKYFIWYNPSSRVQNIWKKNWIEDYAQASEVISFDKNKINWIFKLLYIPLHREAFFYSRMEVIWFSLNSWYTVVKFWSKLYDVEDKNKHKTTALERSEFPKNWSNIYEYTKNWNELPDPFPKTKFRGFVITFINKPSKALGWGFWDQERTTINNFSDFKFWKYLNVETNENIDFTFIWGTVYSNTITHVMNTVPLKKWNTYAIIYPVIKTTIVSTTWLNQKLKEYKYDCKYDIYYFVTWDWKPSDKIEKLKEEVKNMSCDYDKLLDWNDNYKKYVESEFKK